jgi:hypothetical protein
MYKGVEQLFTFGSIEFLKERLSLKRAGFAEHLKELAHRFARVDHQGKGYCDLMNLRLCLYWFEVGDIPLDLQNK